MGTIINGNKWIGACVNGNVVSGLAKNGVVFYKNEAQDYFLVEYVDINNISHITKYTNEDSLLNFTKDNKDIKNCKITIVGQLNIKDIYGMFQNCSNLVSLDISNFDTSKVTDMNFIFMNCSSLTSLDLSNFDTSKVTYMNGLFSGCSGLTSLDLSNFDTSKVTYMNAMFNGCSGLTSLDLSSCTFTNVVSAVAAFDRIPRDCLIKVKDQASKDFVLGVRSNLTNVVIAE